MLAASVRLLDRDQVLLEEVFVALSAVLGGDFMIGLFAGLWLYVQELVLVRHPNADIFEIVII